MQRYIDRHQWHWRRTKQTAAAAAATAAVALDDEVCFD